MRTKKRELGFTMIELVIAVAIFAIMAAIAIPGFSTWLPNYRLKGAVRDLKSTMELSRLRAIRQNANVVLAFDTGNNSYTVFVDNGAGGGVADDFTQNGSEVVLKTVNLPSDVTMYEVSFSGGATRCGFNSRGLPANSRFGHVYMKNTKNKYRGIITTIVGHVQIKESTDGGSWD